MKLVVMLRIKDQIFTIHECLSKLSELVDEIVVVDNGSTDGTLKVYKEYPKVVDIGYTKGFNEGRDKILAHELAKKRKPDWILWIDADEIFEKALHRQDLDKYMQNNILNAVWYRLYHFWGNKTHFRVDKPWFKYTAYPQRPMWRNLDSAYFRDMKFHNGAIMGVPGKHITSRFRLKHFGYVYPEQLLTKKKTYTQLQTDPMSIKTMPFSYKNILTLPFIETRHRIINSLIQIVDKSFWDGVKKFYELRSVINN